MFSVKFPKAKCFAREALSLSQGSLSPMRGGAVRLTGLLKARSIQLLWPLLQKAALRAFFLSACVRMPGLAK